MHGGGYAVIVGPATRCSAVEDAMSPDESQSPEERVAHLKRVLRTVRHVGRLLVEARDEESLIQGVCNTLVDNRGYYNAWIALLEEDGSVQRAAGAGLGGSFGPLLARLRQGRLTRCASDALAQPRTVVVTDPPGECHDCPLAAAFAGRAALTRRLEHDYRVFGFLCISLPQAMSGDEEEQDLVAEVAADVAFGLRRIEDARRARRLERWVQLQDRMTSLGHVTAGIAHEIRNPLSGINIYLNTLEKIYNNPPGPETIPEIIGHLKTASDRIDLVIKRALDFARPSDPSFRGVDLNEPVRAAIDLSRVTLRDRGITVQTALADGLPRCQADPSQIEQVVLNLITNAAEAMGDQDREKRLEIVTRPRGSGVEIRVSDSGPGVPDALRKRILDPFFTTRPESTGVGLAICARIMDDHRGTLGVGKSRLGGAEFVLTIPAEEEEGER